ncbi:MAG: DUF362 domain-containing protein [Deltaproteobacteria bacterium]|nr:DUF362 domain-containing protein [Deltaproteobacteria bacterium]
MEASVAIKKTSTYELGEFSKKVEALVTLLGGIEKFVKPNSRILIKPNLLAAKPRESVVTTDPALVEAAIILVKKAGGRPVVGDSPGIGSAKKVAEKCGIMEVVEKHDAEFIELTTPVNVDNQSGRRFKRFVIAGEALKVDAIINLPKAKTHAQMYLTLGVKNLFGCIPGKRKVQWHMTAGLKTTHFADMLLDLYMYLKPVLTILDGVVSMEGNGPGSGEPKKTGFLLASTDAVALDVIAATILGARPDDVPTLKRAKALGVGTTNLEDITILGDSIEDVKVSGFVFPPLVSTNFTEMLPNFLANPIRKAVSNRPHIETSRCALCNICVAVCPTEVMTNKNNMEIVIDYNGCIRCFCCQEMCPHNAISVKQGFLKKILPGL